MPEHHESLFIHPVTPSLQGSVLSSNTFEKAFTLREEFIVSLVVRWSNCIYLHQFSLTNSSSASSNWFWCATARLDSLLTKDLAEFFEHHQHNLGFYFFILFLKGDSLQLNNRLQWLHKTNYPGCLDARQQKVVERISHPLRHCSLVSQRALSHHLAVQCTKPKPNPEAHVQTSANFAASFFILRHYIPPFLLSPNMQLEVLIIAGLENRIN